MISIGIIGIGFMGMMHSYAFWGKGTSSGRKVRGAKVVAVCTRDPKKLRGDWTSIKGNFGPRGGNEKLSGVRTYQEIERILEDEEIELVDVCLHNHLHREVTVDALRAGKHVLVEKPIAVQVRDADAMTKAAEKAKKHFLVAQVLPFFPEFAWVKKVVGSGKYGNVLGAHFKRIISKPAWAPELVDIEKSGGPGIDLHIHDNHFIQLLFGIPDRVFSRGIQTTGGFLQYVNTQYIYDDRDLTISCASGGLSMPARPFVHGFEIYMEKATLVYESGTMPLSVLHASGRIEPVNLKVATEIDPFVDQIQYAVDVIRKGIDPSTLGAEGARSALLLCHKEAESVKRRRAIRVAK